MPKIRIDYEDWEDADDELSNERIERIPSRRKSEEEVKEHQKKEKPRNAEAARLKEYHEEDEE